VQSRGMSQDLWVTGTLLLRAAHLCPPRGRSLSPSSSYAGSNARLLNPLVATQNLSLYQPIQELGRNLRGGIYIDLFDAVLASEANAILRGLLDDPRLRPRPDAYFWSSDRPVLSLQCFVQFSRKL
jgi:hypothetical protein